MSHADYLTQRLLGSFDVPAFVRRALRVQQFRTALAAKCRSKRRELLRHARWRAGQLCRAPGHPEELLRLLPQRVDPDQWRELWELMEVLPIGSGGATVSHRRLQRMFREWCRSLERFNRRWQEYLHQLDLTSVNGEIEGYNRYYLLEKECFMGSPRLARQGYQPLSTITTDDLLAQFPLLFVPQLANDR